MELRLPAELTGCEAALLNTAEAIQALKQVSAPHIQVQVRRNCQRSCWGEGQATDRSRLMHTPETWCRIALLFAGVADLNALLLTLRGGTAQRGLVELARAGNLRSQIEAWGGGGAGQDQDPMLVFDDGLGGFLPLSQADLSCDPLSLASAGIIPAPSTLLVTAEAPLSSSRPAGTLSPLATRRRRRLAGACVRSRLAGTRRAPGDRAHPRPR